MSVHKSEPWKLSGETPEQYNTRMDAIKVILLAHHEKQRAASKAAPDYTTNRKFTEIDQLKLILETKHGKV